MSRSFNRRSIVLILVALVLLGAAGVSYPFARTWFEKRTKAVDVETGAPEQKKLPVSLVPNEPGRLRVPAEVTQTLGIKTASAEQAPPPEPLKLDGSLFVDANRLVHVHARFSGELVELGELEEKDVNTTVRRAIRFGDAVKKGQLLAVIWSKDLGEKKSELVETLNRLRLNEEKLKGSRELLKKGSMPEIKVKEAERTVESDRITATRVERTLKSWRVSKEEIEAIHREAEEVHAHKGQLDSDVSESWARVEVRAPLDGTVVEKNVVVGDFVDNNIDLFKIADLSRLDVLAHVYEEDLPDLETLAPSQRLWTIFLRTDARAIPLEGSFEQIGNIIDPNQHTALVMGWVDNSTGRLRIGQFVTAQIRLPASPDEVAIPAAALVDQEGQSYVFVQCVGENSANSGDHVFECRRVKPICRRDNLVYLSKRDANGSRDGKLQGIEPGENVVTTGCIELAAELENLRQAQVAETTAAR